MFDQIVVRRSGNAAPILDVGLVAETLLFYQRVHLLIDVGSLVYLIDALGVDNLKRLLQLPGVTASFQRNLCGAHTDRGSGFPIHNFALITVHGKGRFLNDKEYLVETVERKLGLSRTSKKFARYLCEKLSFAPLPERPGQPDDFLRAAAEDLKDTLFIHEGVQDILTTLAPSARLPSNWTFIAHFVGSELGRQPQFVVETNIDFTSLNAEYHRLVPALHSSLSPEFLLAHFLSAREAAFISSRHMAELVIDPVSAALMRRRFLFLMHKRDKQVSQIDLFQEMTLQNAKQLREVINRGERSFEEFLELLDAAQRFKRFLGSQNPDKELVSAYYAEITRKGWVDKLPSKAVRLGVTTGLGAVAEALFPGGVAASVSLGISALDALVVDKVLKGWRPNQFIDEKLIPFISESPRRDRKA
jgi:hypothetical protein